MPRRTLRPYGYKQILLLPSSLREWLPARLDLTPIPTMYGGLMRGTVLSDPGRRVAVLFSSNHGFAAATGLRRSSLVKRRGE